MLVIVLTGGLGAGKSTAAEFFRVRGAVTLDLDRIAEHALAPGSAVLERVAAEFGADDILLADGRLDRPALARKAFASPAATALLNSIVHPAVAAEVGPALTSLRLLAEPPSAVVLEVPLLVEAPVFAELADCVLAVVAPESVRLARAVERGMDEAEARRRIRAQATDAERAALADAVIVNDGPRARFEAQLESFWDAHCSVGGVRR